MLILHPKWPPVALRSRGHLVTTTDQYGKVSSFHWPFSDTALAGEGGGDICHSGFLGLRGQGTCPCKPSLPTWPTLTITPSVWGGCSPVNRITATSQQQCRPSLHTRLYRLECRWGHRSHVEAWFQCNGVRAFVFARELPSRVYSFLLLRKWIRCCQSS